MKDSTVFDVKIIELPKFCTNGGNITAINNGTEIPFDTQRIYYLYDIPSGESRGGHAHTSLEQLIVAASGSFDLVIDDGNLKRTFNLNRPYQAILMPPGLWRELHNFSSGAICLVLASAVFLETDYIRDYNDFKLYKS